MSPQDRKLTPEEQEFIGDLYETYFNQVYIYVNARLKNDDYARDIVQDVFHAAAEKPENVMTHENPIAWLKKVARNKMSVSVRSNQRMMQRIVFMDTSALEEVVGAEEPGFQRVEDESENPLQKVKDALSPDEFQLMWRLTFDKVGHLTVAKEFGITVWRSQKRLERIRDKLRSVFPGYRKKKRRKK